MQKGPHDDIYPALFTADCRLRSESALRVTALKVLDCYGSGWNTDVIKAIDWLTSNRKLPAVANMSLAGGVDPTEDAAIVRSVTLGNVFYALAASNNASDACNYSPARSGKGNNGIVTTAATDSSNAEAYFSNYGACVDIWAPGVDINSTYPGNRFASMNGTSMASPHVAGSGALFLSLYPNSSPVEVEQSARFKFGQTNRQHKRVQPLAINQPQREVWRQEPALQSL